jgi:hypothetical protein
LTSCLTGLRRRWAGREGGWVADPCVCWRRQPVHESRRSAGSSSWS